jgi:hypothetical protein
MRKMTRLIRFLILADIPLKQVSANADTFKPKRRNHEEIPDDHCLYMFTDSIVTGVLLLLRKLSPYG